VPLKFLLKGNKKILLPDVSIIIPCYNAGINLQYAVASIKENCRNLDYEIIVTNDGSIDEQTLSILNELASKNCMVLHQQNKGPAAARNTAVKASAAPYLFFLDSDNRVRKNYIEKGIAVLEKDLAIGVVYGKPYFFGETTKPRFITKAFDFNSLLFDNYIDTCSVIRRKVWDDVSGFDEASIVTLEDWEFWIRVALAGWKFYFIDEYLFDYRIVNASRSSSSVEEGKHEAMREYVFKKHLPVFMKQYRFFAAQYFVYKDDQEKPLRSFLKYMYGKYFGKKQ
jgi:glycosyltransferase involved in cell wall biosynthesis